jgi:N-acetylmuramic acid 6-phosphate etherase
LKAKGKSGGANRQLAHLRSLDTERANPASAGIDQVTATDIVAIINAQDATVAAAVEKELPRIAQAVDLIVNALKNGGRLFYIGAGTAGRLGVLDASEIPPTYNVSGKVVGIIAGGHRALTHAAEGAEDSAAMGRRDLAKRKLKSRDVVIGITASGRTPYTIGALEYARKIGAAAIALACNANPEIARAADLTIAVATGPEVVAGSTRMKAGTAQKMVLNMLSTAAMIRLGHVRGNYMVNVRMTNEKLRARGVTILQEILGVDRAEAARRLKRAKNNLKLAITSTTSARR